MSLVEHLPKQARVEPGQLANLARFDPGQLGDLGAGSKLGRRVEQLRLHQHDHGESRSLHSADAADFHTQTGFLAELALEAARDALVATLEPAARHRPRLVATVRAMDQQDATLIVPNQRCNADREASVAQTQVQVSDGAWQLSPDAQQPWQHTQIV